MVDPITTATIVTLVLTKALEKNGEKITDALWNASEKLLTKIKEKNPLIGMKLEQVQNNPILMKSHPKDFGIDILEGEMVEIVKESDMKILMEEIAQLVKPNNTNIRRMIAMSDVEAEECIEFDNFLQIASNEESIEQIIMKNVKAKTIKITNTIQEQ